MFQPQDQIYMVDESSNHLLVTPKELTQLFRDPKSWESFLHLILDGKTATMTAVPENEEKETLKIIRRTEAPERYRGSFNYAEL